MRNRAIVSGLGALALALSLCGMLGCSDDSGGSSGWGLEQGSDDQDAVGADTAAADVDSSDVSDPSDVAVLPADAGRGADAAPAPRCPSGQLPREDGRCAQLFLLGAELGPAFGGDSYGASSAPADFYIDGRVSLGSEHQWGDEGLFNVNIGPRVLLVGQSIQSPDSLSRLVVLDATDDYTVLGDFRVQPPAAAGGAHALIRSAAYALGAKRSYVPMSGSNTLVVFDESDGPGRLRYLELDGLGTDYGAIRAVSSDGPNTVVGVVDGPSGDASAYLFAFDATTEKLIDQGPQTPGVQLIELPRGGQRIQLLRTAGHQLVVTLSPGSALAGVNGGIYRVDSIAEGRYRSAGQLVSSEALGGDPRRLMMTGQSSGLVQLDGPQARGLYYFELDDRGLHTTSLGVSSVRGMCASPGRGQVLVASPAGFYSWSRADRRRVEPLAEDLLSYDPMGCAFAP